ncbi:hypothetical protein H9X95_16965 [Micromonospora chalcea]|uniref:NACHT domain-containing protein n=1 Tax=Micromonospora chalcea TaxID=1874 RepID=UPI001656B583|nr:hypothetical protein [Micromonospora chalcea]MBC8991840.1 hypothetical protein [Micromonospora chalcea]
MEENGIFTTTVKRLCRIRSGTVEDELPFPLDGDGFLDPSAVQNGPVVELVPGALVATETAARAGSLVLLGEPGVGKTTEFAALVRNWNQQPTALSPSPIVEVDAADLSDATFDELLGRHLRRLPERHLMSGGDTPVVGLTTGRTAADLIVVIDQIDESPLVRHLAARLRLALRGRDTSRARFIFGCRTADYPPDLTNVLTSHFGPCIVADLAPLTRQEAVRLAASADQIDGESLVASAVAAGAGVLASVPLTLGLLIRTYRRTGHLNARPTELFALGVTQLLSEHDDERRTQDDESTLDQRLAIAERIAARLLLSNRRTIWRGAVLESGEQDLNAESIAGGQESVDNAAFVVTKRAVSATLATALFTGRGRNRLAFRHGSFAGFLTARHLIGRAVPVIQLQRLFLVAGSDDSRSVPIQLREAAAWLVTLDPSHAQWLADADPESLVAHSSIVDSPEVRSLVVDALLRRAGEVELGDVPWARAPRRLKHPGLGAQLLTVLNEAGDREPQDWPSLARLRLAVRLAREAGVPELVGPLLDLAAKDGWSSHLRLLAAMTAFETSPTDAAPQLAQVASSLVDASYASRVDPDDELRGALLDMLWPAYISVEDVLQHLRPRRNRNLVGSYLGFEMRFASELAEEDLPAVLEWAIGQLHNGRSPSELRSSTADVQGSDEEPPDERPVGRLDIELIDGIVERALSGDGALSRAREVALILRPRLERFDHPPLPTAVDAEDEDGREPPRFRDLRHALAHSLVELAATTDTFDRAKIWAIADGWGTRDRSWRVRKPVLPDGLRRANRGYLLTGADFPWAYERASEALGVGNRILAEALAQVAGYLFDLSDAASGELAYSNPDHPVWPHVKWWFEPVPLDSDLANLWRQAHGRRRDRVDDGLPSVEREEFVAKLNQLLADAAAGNVDAFWRLAWQLQADPNSGEGTLRLDDDILDFPGLAALDGSGVDVLIEAAVHFIANEHDHSDEWLGTNRYDKRGWAGYLALALLERKDRLSEVPNAAWSSWAGALIWFHTVPSNAGDREIKLRLLSRAVEHSASQLAAAVDAYVRGELMQGHLASETELVDPAWHVELADTFAALLTELADAITRTRGDDGPSDAAGQQAPHPAPDEPPNGRKADQAALSLTTDESRTHALQRWEEMLVALLQAQDQRAVDTAHHALEADVSSGWQRQLAARAARALLTVDSHQYLATVLSAVGKDAALGRDVALCLGASYSDFLADLEEEQLAELYRWLSGLFPPEDDVPIEGVHFVGPEEQTREWRDRVLQSISSRGSEQALRALTKLRDEYPSRVIITSHILRARTNLFASAWSPPTPVELAALFEDANRRLVRSERELADLLVEVLEAIGNDLPTHGELLWDRLPARVLPKSYQLKEAWLPKPEPALSAYISHELTKRLERRGLAVNREVLVRPTDAYGAGDRTDIQIEATMRDDPVKGPTPDRIVVVIEVKGPWNRELLSAQQQQLAQRYLPEAGTRTGIYLVGWYPLEQWTYKGDYRRRRVAQLSEHALLASLETQAASITRLDALTVPFLLTIPRPHRNSDGT